MRWVSRTSLVVVGWGLLAVTGCGSGEPTGAPEAEHSKAEAPPKFIQGPPAAPAPIEASVNPPMPNPNDHPGFTPEPAPPGPPSALPDTPAKKPGA